MLQTKKTSRTLSEAGTGTGTGWDWCYEPWGSNYWGNTTWGASGDLSCCQDKDDGRYAKYEEHSLLGGTFTTHELHATDFNFDIPPENSIVGIKVDVYNYFVDTVLPGESTYDDKETQLIVGGVKVGSDLSDGLTYPENDYKTWGDNSELWGVTPTASQINSNDFGISLKGEKITTSESTLSFSFDVIEITVYHELPPVPTSYEETTESAKDSFNSCVNSGTYSFKDRWPPDTNTTPLETQGDGKYMTTDDMLFFDGGNIGKSCYLVANDFQLNIPFNAQIKGIKAKVYYEEGAFPDDSDYRDVEVFIYKNGVAVGDNKASREGTTGYVEYGGWNDDWSTKLSASDVNKKAFGLAIAVNTEQVDQSAWPEYRVDYVELTVYWKYPTENDPVELEQDAESKKQFYCKVFDKNYNYLNTLNIDDLSNVPSYSQKADGFSSMKLNTVYSYKDYILGNGLVRVDGVEVQSEVGQAKIKDILQCGNIIDVFISDRDGLNIHIYNGVVDGYNTTIKSGDSTLDINLIPNTTILSARVLKDSSTTPITTTIDYNSYDPSDMIKDIIDKSETFIGYSDETIPTAVGVSRSYEFKAELVATALKKAVELCPDFWIGYVDADNNFNLKNMYEATLHEVTDNQLISINANISMLQLRNSVYFLGAGDPPMFNKYDKKGSQNTYGVFEHKIVDGRVTNTSTAEVLANRYLKQHQSPAISLQVVLMDNNFSNEGDGVNIEKFEIGDRIKVTNNQYNNSGVEWGETNWGENYWGADYMQIYGRIAYITGIAYAYDRVILDCVFDVVQSQQRVEDLSRDLIRDQFNEVPDQLDN